MFTPLNPQRSGISDYAEDLLPHLGALAQVELVTGPYRPSTPGIAQSFRVLSPEEFLTQPGRYDAVVYQVGNNARYHAYMLPCLRRVPGIVVLHDCSLGYLVLNATLARGDVSGLRGMLLPVLGQRSDEVIRQILLGRLDPYNAPLTAPVVAWSRGVIVHSQYALTYLRQAGADKPAAVIPMGVPRVPEALSDPAARARLGIGQDDFVLLSLGNLAPNKRLGLLLSALAALTGRPWRLLIVGGGQPDALARRLLRRPELRQRVIRTGWASPAEYAQAMYLANLVVDLRYPTAGETSASLMRALAYGKGALLSAAGTFLELPDDCAVKVPVDHDSSQLGAILAALLDDPQRTRQMGAAARRFAQSNLRLETAAARYVEFIRQCPAAPPAPEARAWPSSPWFTRLVVGSIYKAARLRALTRQYGGVGLLRRALAGARCSREASHEDRH